jgi:glucose-6-phosphate 1-dehydrogenase
VSRAVVEPHLFVIFGPTGDLARRKLLPALGRLVAQGILSDGSVILGASRGGAVTTDQGFRDWTRRALDDAGLSPGQLTQWCDRCLHYQPLARAGLKDYGALADRIVTLEKAHGLPGNRLFYLALPPVAFPDVITELGQLKLSQSDGWTRIVIEKPFGHDLGSARALNQLVHRYFEESQIYRIDHYLGKETVQNLLAFRFANPIFESLWNRDRVESVQIVVAEDLGIEERAGYYEQAGALRDMVQNHLTQLLTLTAMEVPAVFEADAIRYEKVKVLRSIESIRPEDVVFGQYAHSQINGKKVSGYREEPGVAKDSQAETFVALKLEIENWRWHGVPFILRTGKRLARKLTQIAVVFRRPPIALFPSLDPSGIHSNVLLLTLQPNEGFRLSFEVKSPGPSYQLSTQHFHFQYAEAFGALSDAYETLLLDALMGDQTLFVHADEVEASWKLYTPLLESHHPVHSYRAGTWGPPEADRLLGDTPWITG